MALALLTALPKAVAVAGDAVGRALPLLAALVVGGCVWSGWRMLQSLRRGRARAAALTRLRIPLARLDAMNDQEFEFALRDLLIRDGWSARRVGQRGDQGADVIAESREYGRIVIQAKHTTVGAKVGSHVMYEVNGTAGPVHGADHAVVVTNGGFTRDADGWGRTHRVHRVDRHALRSWAEQGTSVQDELRLRRAPARRMTLRRAA